MERWEKFKQYVRAPPPHLIAKMEYRGHFLNILGVLAVCIVLIFKGYWYAIFAIIFSVMVSLAQGMSAYARYTLFLSLQPEETYKYILDDVSFTRRRNRLVQKKYPLYVRWLFLPIVFLFAIRITGIHAVKIDWAFRIFGFPILAISWYLLGLAVLTLLLYFLLKYIVIAGMIQRIERQKEEKRREQKIESMVVEPPHTEEH